MSSEPIFAFFGHLQLELKSHVLSFVADAPFENGRNPRSSLTNTLPFVSKEFHAISNSNDLWELAIIRRLETEPFLWEDGIIRLVDPAPSGGALDKSPKGLIDRALSTLGMNAKDIYRRVINESIRVRSPMFIMRAALNLGEPYGLHLFEPRYALLIDEVMRPQPEHAKRGGPMDSNLPPPRFLHAHCMPIEPSAPAAVVQVLRCEIYPDGSADVILLPIFYVWLETIRKRPHAMNLYEATSIRMGRDETSTFLRGSRSRPFFNF